MQGKDKRILLFNRSFWPDIEATSQFLTELCEELVKIYKVTVIAGRSYYLQKETFLSGRFYSRELFNDIEILRVRHTRLWKASVMKRLINWFTYSALAFIVALRIKPDLIIACTDPPFLGIMAMILARLKSIPFIYNCADLYPDFAIGTGKLKKGFLSYIYDYLNKKALSKAQVVVSLGSSMQDRLKSKGVSPERLRVIPDWVDTSVIKPVAKVDNPLLEKWGLKNKFIIMYSGNIGLSQGFSAILQSIALLEKQLSFYLVFIGEGAGKEALRKEAERRGIKNILFLPYQPREFLSFSLGMAGLHIVPLKKGMAGASVPSKIYGIMAAARPYLAITDKESEPSRLTEEYGCGLWVDPDDIEAIAKTFSWAISHPDDLEKMGGIARQVAVAKFDKKVVIREWLELLKGLW